MDFEINETFNSYDAFLTKLKLFEEHCFMKLYKRSSRTTDSALKRAPNKKYNERLKYSEIDMACIHGGKRFVSMSTGKRPSTSTFQMHCPFLMKLRASQDGQKLVVTSVNDEHNHDVSEATFRHLPHQRKMNVEQKEQVKTMLQMKANKKLVQQHIRKEMGQFVLLKDLHNMCGKEKGAPAVNLEAIVNELRQSEDAVVEVVEKEGVLQALFYQRKEWQRTYCQYPEVILIDATYKLNELRMPLYLMLCVDGNGESEVVAMWLVSSEDKLTMKAMIGCFKKHNNAEKTTCVMADKDWVERDVIVEELPHATLLICLFHVLRTFRREVSERGMGITQDQRHQALELLEKLAYSANDVEYCINRDALFALGLTKVFNYFLKQWDGIRHQWVEGLKNNAKHLLNNTNNRLESINQKIKDVVGRRLDLLQFFRELLKYFDSMSQERDHRAAMVFAKVPADLHRSNPLVSYQQHLTPYAFSAVKKQYEQSHGIAIPEGSGTTMRMERRDGLITISTTACECGFFRAISLPCRHMLALRKFHGQDVFISDSCSRRWTRDYYRQHRVFKDPIASAVQVDISAAPAAQRPLSQHEKYRAAFLQTQRLASICSELPLRQFFPALEVLEKLSNAWQEGKHVSIQVLSTSDSTSPTNDLHELHTSPTNDLHELHTSPTNDLHELHTSPTNDLHELHTSPTNDLHELHTSPTNDLHELHTSPTNDLHELHTSPTVAANDPHTSTAPTNFTTHELCTSPTPSNITTNDLHELRTSPTVATNDPHTSTASTNFTTHELCTSPTPSNITTNDIHELRTSPTVTTNELRTSPTPTDIATDELHATPNPTTHSVSVDVHHSLDYSPPAQRTQCQALSAIGLPPKMLKRGRPKGADLTVIGLPIKRRKVVVQSQPQPKPFVQLSGTEKEMVILSMIVGEAPRVDRLLSVRDLTKDLPTTLLEDCVDISIVKKYFDRGAFLVLCANLKRLKNSAVWLCGHCHQDTALHTKAVACDSCLQWHHAKCVHSKGKVPRSRFWCCKKCMGGS